ncbi:MAG: HypC/HybG/HupF family hydrogenase formation chaperone [Candidatus Hadarchaeales archaeon]
MCLAIPGKVVEKKGELARVDFGDGTLREVDVSLVEVEVGQYVIVHAGFAIQVLDEEEARESLRLWQELLSQG